MYDGDRHVTVFTVPETNTKKTTEIPTEHALKYTEAVRVESSAFPTTPASATAPYWIAAGLLSHGPWPLPATSSASFRRKPSSQPTVPALTNYWSVTASTVTTMTTAVPTAPTVSKTMAASFRHITERTTTQMTELTETTAADANDTVPIDCMTHLEGEQQVFVQAFAMRSK